MTKSSGTQSAERVLGDEQKLPNSRNGMRKISPPRTACMFFGLAKDAYTLVAP
jgi:hypothetical protein